MPPIRTRTGPLGSAEFSACGKYRYMLERKWGRGPVAVFIGLNPSTADETRNDPTVRRCIGFAKSWSCGGLIMLNLFAYRATRVIDMKAQRDPVGPGNDDAIRSCTRRARLVVAAWGVHGTHLGRDREVEAIVARMQCLGRSQAGHPRHPLYLRRETGLELYTVK